MVVIPEPCKEFRRRISAAISGWNRPVLTFIYPGFGSNVHELSPIWLWLKKTELQDGLPWEVETWSKTCGLPLRSFNFEPQPYQKVKTWSFVLQGRLRFTGFSPSSTQIFVLEAECLGILDVQALLPFPPCCGGQLDVFWTTWESWVGPN